MSVVYPLTIALLSLIIGKILLSYVCCLPSTHSLAFLSSQPTLHRSTTVGAN